MNKILSLVLIALAVAVTVAVSGCVIGGQEEPQCGAGQTLVNNTCCFDDNHNSICDAVEVTCPATCDDGNKCTNESCSEKTNYQCVYGIVKPCCGNKICEPVEDMANTCREDCIVLDVTNFTYSQSAPDYMDGETFVYIHTGKAETNKPAAFYSNISSNEYTLKNIRYTYNCTDSTGNFIDNINSVQVQVVENLPDFGMIQRFENADYNITSSLYSAKTKDTVLIPQLDKGNMSSFKITFAKKVYTKRSNLFCTVKFYFYEPLKVVTKTLRISYI